MTNQRPGQLAPQKVEEAYDLLTSYRFAQRYVEGKSVANISTAEPGYGSWALTNAAESVTNIAGSGEAHNDAASVHSAPNLDYQEADLPRLPYDREHFDVAIAFKLVEKMDDPETAIKEIKRILKRAGLLILSTPDKQTYSNDRNHGEAGLKDLYVPELKELLEDQFTNVQLYRQGSVSGGLIFQESSTGDAKIERASFSSTVPAFNPDFPDTHFVLAVCSDSEIPGTENERPYLLLDSERSLFEEYEDLQEDVQLLREEIRLMQETEVQAFRDATKFRGSEISYLNTRLERLEESEQHLLLLVESLQAQNSSLEAQNKSLKEHLKSIENSRTWRVFDPYRRLRAMLNHREK